MKRALITLVALAVGMTAFAQYGPRGYGHNYGYGRGYHSSGYYMQDGALEFGIMFNHFSKAGDTFRPDRMGFFGEYRVKVNPVVDMGLQLSTTFGKGSLLYANQVENSYGDDMWFWQGAPLVVTDFNLFPYSGFNPYFGLGIGPGFGYGKNIVKEDRSREEGNWTQALVLSPRAGVELFECLRISVHYQWYLSNWSKFSHIGFGISWAFNTMGRGGRPLRR